MKTPAVYRRERLNESKKRKAQRVARNTARQRAIKKGKAKVGDGTHVDHKTPLSKGGGNGESNTRVISAKANMQKATRTTARKRKRNLKR